jgi:hypothetical protein
MKLASQSNADTGVADMSLTKSTTKSHRSEQANEMLHILNDMFFFFYTQKGPHHCGPFFAEKYCYFKFSTNEFKRVSQEYQDD